MKWLVALALFRTVLCAPHGHTADENEGIESKILVEGDMRLTKKQVYNIEHGLDVDSSRKRGSIADNSLWPNGLVPYEIHPSISGIPRAVNAINQGLAEWTSKTCLRFKEREGESDYIIFGDGGGCWSYVGRRGGRQPISLSNGCWWRGTVTHEIAHALGFYHEQSRPDRDEFVTILWDNIETDKESNFRKYSRSTIDSLGTPYDYGSVMHYGAFAFSRNNQPTIVVKQTGQKIGQRNGLSPVDAEQANLLYRCGPRKETTTLPPTTTQPPKTTQPPTVSCTDNLSANLCNILKSAFTCVPSFVSSYCEKTCNKRC